MYSKKRLIWVFSIILMLTMVVSACSSGTKEGTDGEKSGNTGGDLIVAMLSEAPSTDPHMATDVTSSTITTHLYDTLVKYDKDLKIQPSLAESWKAIDDVTWEFKLRKGVKYTDGSEFNASVVKANIDRLLDPKVASPRAAIVNMIKEVKVVDDSTVQITTMFPFSPILAHLTHSGVGMISAEAIKKDYEKVNAGEKPGTYLTKNPAGTGAFKLESWNQGQDMKLVRSDTYWGTKAKIDSVTFKVVSEAATRIAELETGYAHIMDQVSPSDMKRVEDLPNASLNRQASLSLAYVGFNMTKKPFDDVRVRQAISMAINKEEIISGIYQGTGLAPVGPLAPVVNGFDESVKPIEYNLDKAKALLKEAGLEKGFSTTIWTNDNPDRVKIAEYVQNKLKALNIEVKIEVLEWGAYLAQTAEAKHDMFILGWVTATADADYGLYLLFHSSAAGTPGNRTFTKDPELDKLLDDARKENDPDKRKAMYKTVQEKLVNLAPMLYIIHTEYIDGISDKVEGFWKHPNGAMMLHDVSLKK